MNKNKKPFKYNKFKRKYTPAGYSSSKVKDDMDFAILRESRTSKPKKFEQKVPKMMAKPKKKK